MPSWSEIITDVNLYSNAGIELDKSSIFCGKTLNR